MTEKTLYRWKPGEAWKQIMRFQSTEHKHDTMRRDEIERKEEKKKEERGEIVLGPKAGGNSYVSRAQESVAVHSRHELFIYRTACCFLIFVTKAIVK